ncbi:MAG: hypothetical protein ABIL09_07660 [Gemmatimonadota bacterium]
MPDAPARRARQYVSAAKDEAIAWQRQLRADLLRLLRLDDLVGAPRPDFETEVLSREPRDGCLRQELRVHTTAGRTMEMLLTLPPGSHQLEDGSIPGVVCIHGHGGDRFAVHDPDSIYLGFAAALAAGGYATVAVDVGQHQVYEAGRTLLGERLWDLMRGVDCLAALPQVDAARLGCAGLSLGGEMAMWLGALDERVAAEVSAGFLTTMDQMEQNHCMCWKLDGLRELVDFADLYALTAPRALMCQNGLQEPETQFYVPLAQKAFREIIPAYRVLGAPKSVVLHVHGGGHEVALPALLSFLDQHLGGHAAAAGRRPGGRA